MSYCLRYHALDPWHPGEPQVLVVALKFREFTTFFVPFMCVAAVAAVELYPVPWQVLHE